MWMMTDDERTVTPQEWECLKLGLDLLAERLFHPSEPHPEFSAVGISVFDDLTVAQRLTLLANVCTALREPSVPAPERSAVQDGTIAALLLAFWNQIEIELDLSEDDDYPLLGARRALLSALDSNTHPFPIESPSTEYLPDLFETESEIWYEAFSSFESRFLDDFDYQMESLADLPGDVSYDLKETMGIEHDYFVTIAPEPNDRELITVRQVLARLLDLPVPDDSGQYPALHDRYSNLYCGPCSDEQFAKWSSNPWIEKTSHDSPNWDCEYDVWLKNFSATLKDAKPTEADNTAEFEAQRELRRKQALEAIGSWEIPF